MARIRSPGSLINYKQYQIRRPCSGSYLAAEFKRAFQGSICVVILHYWPYNIKIRKAIKRIISFIMVVSLVLPVSSQVAGWRGPGRTGVYNETGLLKSWPVQGPKFLWETTGHGKGYGSVTVTGDAVYITGVHGDSITE
jgi:hypothetical protein